MRFIVEKRNQVWFVKDTEAHLYNLPEEACTLFFGSPETPQAIADELNKAWNKFMRIPG